MLEVLALWDYDDPAGSRERFPAALAQEHDVVRRQVLLTQVARADGLAGEFERGHRVLDELGEPGDLADEPRDRAVRARERVRDGRAAAYSLHVARWTRARAARALGRHDEALAEQHRWIERGR